jgi:hypothetical protein
MMKLTNMKRFKTKLNRMINQRKSRMNSKSNKVKKNRRISNLKKSKNSLSNPNNKSKNSRLRKIQMKKYKK